MGFTVEQTVLLQAPLAEKHIKSRDQAGKSLFYIEAWYAIAEANRIFGHDGWSRETLEMREARQAELVDVKKRNSNETYQQWRVGFVSRVRITAGGVSRDGTGYGSGFASDLGDAYESAVKEAESDATKRALMTFGWPLGLAIYDKRRENVSRETAPVRQPSPPRTNPAAPRSSENPFDGPPPAKADIQQEAKVDIPAAVRKHLGMAKTCGRVDTIIDWLKERRDLISGSEYDKLYGECSQRYAELEPQESKNVRSG